MCKTFAQVGGSFGPNRLVIPKLRARVRDSLQALRLAALLRGVRGATRPDGRDRGALVPAW